RYVAFDILRDLEGNWLLDKTWLERRGILLTTMETIRRKADVDGMDDIKHFDVSRVEINDKRGFYAEILGNQGEGVILKHINGKYFPDKKPMWNWVKVKKHITDDVVVMGFKPPVRVYEGKELATWQYWEKQDITHEEVTSEMVFIEEGFGEEALVA